MFDAYLTDKTVPETDPGVTALYGRITIESFSETFISSLVCWNTGTYYKQWCDALSRVERGEPAAIITSYVEPGLASHLTWWPLYPQGDIVYVPNHMLFYEQLQKPFSIRDPWAVLRVRRTGDSEGRQISEWVTDVASIRECLIRTEGRLRELD